MSELSNVKQFAPPVRATENLAKRLLASAAQARKARDSISETTCQIMLPIYRGESFNLEHDLRALDVTSFRQQIEIVREAAFGRAKPNAIRMALGLLLDAIPAAQRLESASYIDAAEAIVVDDPDGFSTEVIANSIRSLLQTTKFAPSISEILAELNKQRSTFRAALGSSERLVARAEKLKALT